MPILVMTKSQALAAAAQILTGVDGNNPTDVIGALAVAARAYIELGNALGDAELTWREGMPLITGELTRPTFKE